jgi:hypothetical protein
MEVGKMHKQRRVALNTTINKDVSDKLDAIASERGWPRPLAARHLVEALIRSLDKAPANWRSIDELQINSAFGEFEKRA